MSIVRFYWVCSIATDVAGLDGKVTTIDATVTTVEEQILAIQEKLDNHILQYEEDRSNANARMTEIEKRLDELEEGA